MKNIFRISACMLAVAGMLISCNKEETPQHQPEEVGTKTVNVVGTLSGDATKVVFADGTGLAWEEIDLTSMAIATTAYVENGQPDSKYNATNTVSKEGSIDGGKAYFTFEVPADHTEGYLFYPNVQVGWYEIHFQFPADITQAEAGFTNNLKLISDKIDLTATGAEAVDAKFRINGHLLRYFIYDSEGSEVAVKSVTLKANTNIAGQYTVRPEGSEAVGGSLSTKATVTLTNPYALAGVTSTAQAKTVFMPIIPATSEGYTYQVTTESGDIYEFESTKTKTWEDGAITEVALNLSKATNFISSSEVRKKELVFEFTNKGVAVLDRSFAYSGGTANTDYFIVMVDGQEVVDYGNTYYNDFRYEVVDALGNAQDWVTANRSSNNSFDIVCQANEATEERTAVINVYFDDTDEYEVVGTYKTLDKQYAAISCADPILTLTVTQEGKPVVDEPIALDYHFTDKGAPLALNIGNGGWHATFERAHRVFVDGVEVYDPNATYYKDFTFEIVYDDPAAAGWVNRAYLYSGIDLNLEIQANATYETRSCTVNVYYHDPTGIYKVNSTIKGEDKTTVTYITDSQTEPIYTFRVNQEGQPKPADPGDIVYMFTNGKGVGSVTYNAGAAANSWNPGWYAVAVGGKGGSQTADGSLPYFASLRYVATDADGNPITWLSGAQNAGKNESLISWEANDTGAERTGYVSLYLDPTDEYRVVGTYKNGHTYEELQPTDAVITFIVTQAAQ